MVVLRDVVQAYPEVRVILMSATIDTTMFKEYFFSAPVIEVHGRTFPVQGKRRFFFTLLHPPFIVIELSALEIENTNLTAPLDVMTFHFTDCNPPTQSISLRTVFR